MITDRFNLFTDNETVRATGVSTAVKLMPYAGNDEPLHVTVIATEKYPATAGITVTVQKSEDGVTYTGAGVYPFTNLTGPDARLCFTLSGLGTATWVRLAYTVTGNPDTGKLWAGITREHIAPYEPGLYINKGRVVA